MEKYHSADEIYRKTAEQLSEVRDFSYTPARNIVTVHVYPPIPSRAHDWCAYDENTYDGPGSVVGWGATEHAAMQDLMEQLDGGL